MVTQLQELDLIHPQTAAVVEYVVIYAYLIAEALDIDVLDAWH